MERKYGIAYTEDGGLSSKIQAWLQKDGKDVVFLDLGDALEACENDGWRGYVFSYPDGTRPATGWA